MCNERISDFNLYPVWYCATIILFTVMFDIRNHISLEFYQLKLLTLTVYASAS